MAEHPTIAALPRALERLRRRANVASLRPAAVRIHERTGHRVSVSAMSQWNRGTMPRTDHLILFLDGLGFTFADLQQEIEGVIAEDAEDDPAAAIVRQLTADPELRAKLRAYLDTEDGSAAAADLMLALEDLDRSTANGKRKGSGT